MLTWYSKYRSRSGCLTCRARRVKCDETHPTCKACSKKNRPCQWEEPHTKFKDYRPGGASSSKFATGGTDDENEARDNLDGADGEDGEDEDEEMDGADGIGERSRSQSISQRNIRKNSQTDGVLDSPYSSTPSASAQGFSAPPYYVNKVEDTRGHVPMETFLAQESQMDQHPLGTAGHAAEPIPLTHEEALLVHHYTEHIGRWLDCTDATDQFTLGVPEKITLCSVLRHAVIALAARHSRNDSVADAAYQRCISLLILRLNEEAASHDETLLCAIVILHFYEQLSVPSSVGLEDEQHLAGCSAIIRSSQGHHFVDPSAPTLREAAFWVYVRQCIHKATINQQPLDIDFSLQLHPTPSSMRDAHPLARLRLETAWSNQMAWNLARVVNFCYDGNEVYGDMRSRMQQWEELWELVHTWMRDRPAGFNPIYQGPVDDSCSFPNTWFTADWHAVSFCYYHFACIMLLRFRPHSDSVVHDGYRLSETDHQILSHAQAICGAAKSSKEAVPLAITVRHTVFIWGPLVSSEKQRKEIIEILADFERDHVWPTAWLINALRNEWDMSGASTASSPMKQ
ncbi:hypothetical protein COCVIDRAFT_40633 [Bipolaris victoriae FI3]|uniref:Zn(2)-C6 fungal-type domain-containing protein n=1 Tax=Bipolaris victoriae (strain FI3) TaxID=930091 RepID=W7E0B9_BIPV3|nr:hypothetical protein COCVIDRAFT_40633 [Bipolaris victoriae FI3]